MVVFLILINGRRFDPHFGYRAALKLVANIHLLNGPIKCEKFIIKLTVVNILKNKKNKRSDCLITIFNIILINVTKH